MKKIAFYTLGCRANQAQTFGLECQMTNDKCQLVDFAEKADIYVINTCTVTIDADRKSRQAIRKALRQNPKAKIIVAGCYARLESKYLKLNFPSVELLLEPRLSVSGSDLKPRIRANLMIQDGCEHFCSYCIVPYARGKIKSKPLKQVLEEAEQLVQAGAREIILTGINLGTYQHSLSSLLAHLSSLKNLYRVRLSSLEPMYLDRELIDTVAENTKVCNHFHIPLQSGDNGILSAMNRNYTRDDYLELIDYIRKKIPACGITTDVIVGFPGEGEKEFQNTIDIINEIKFSRVHIFSFSKRKGTPAADLPAQIDEKEKQKRNKYLHCLRKKYMIEFARNYLHQEVEILVEQKGEGLTSNYIRVLYPAEGNDIGKLRQTKIKEIQDGFCRAF